MTGRTFLVTGATGTVGSALAARLVAHGHHVRSVSTSGGTDLATADLAPLFESVDGAFLLTPVRPDMETLGIRVAQAALSAGVPRLVRLSAATGMHRPGCLVGLAHGAADAVLLSARPDAVVLRPHGFMQNLLGMAGMIANGTLAQPLDGDSADAMIDARDIAACAAAALEGEPGEAAGVHDLTGPEALSPRDVAGQLGEVLGWPVAAVAVQDAEARAALTGAGVPAWFVDRILEMRAVQESGAMATPTDAVRRLTGRAPNALRQFLREHSETFRQAPAPG